MEKQRVHMPKKRFKELSKKIKAGEIKITDELVIEIAKYKFYYMLNNAKNVRVKRRNDYKEVQYKLGAFSKGFDNLKKYRPDLFEKLLQIVRTYLENRMNDDLAPTIHRLKQHYEWEHIDIITAQEHMKIDTYVPVIVRNEMRMMAEKPKKAKRLTMRDIRKMAQGKKFETTTAAIEYAKSTYGVSENSIKKYIDSGEMIVTESGRFEIVREQNIEKVDDEMRRRRHEMFLQRYPQFHEIGQKFIELIRNTDEKKLRFILKWSMIQRKKHRLVRATKRLIIVHGSIENYFKISV